METVETITHEIAGKMLNKSAEAIRSGLRQERFPFGATVQGMKGQWSYILQRLVSKNV